jgi:AAA15 family ATPase/GTPase
LDASLHPVLVAHLISLFQDPSTNPGQAQLIFNSHDTTILGDSTVDRIEGRSRRRLIGRDQIWFTEKANEGATRLYALSDLAPRKDEAIERRYLAGRYGATPIVSRARLGTMARELANGKTEG